MTRTLRAALLMWSVPLTAHAQRETVVVDQRITLTDELTPAAAKRRALEEAMAEAVRRVVGVRVRSTAISTTTETSAGFSSDYRSIVQLDAVGRAVDVQLQRETWETVDDAVRYRGTWAITVEREVGTPDPGFTLDLSVPRTCSTPPTRTPPAMTSWWPRSPAPAAPRWSWRPSWTIQSSPSCLTLTPAPSSWLPPR
ncbi:MAG: hypothetical protein IPK85_13460 [Gemmatimonadetes bacterium]|nr:hypothetical protein [Gemmatimonadota bacterium]